MCFSLIDSEEELTEQAKVEKRKEEAKKRALSSSIIRELQDEYSEAPQEIVVSGRLVLFISSYNNLNC